jgi:hypothetical protein
MDYFPGAPFATESCWIDPKGGFWPVNTCGHTSFAEWTLNRMPEDEKPQVKWPVDALEKLGWIHVSDGYI